MSRDPDLPPLEDMPVHVGIIMDGNGRWAKQRGLPRIAGHRAGTENLRHILRASVDFGIKILTIYAFSTENWARPKEEVEGLMHILGDVIDRELAELHENGVQLRHIGDLTGLPEVLQRKVNDAIDLTQNNDRLILNVAFGYGGRTEIVEAIRKIVHAGYGPDEIDEELVSSYMYTSGLPDPDLIIRTSGEMRVSNFLVWQGIYAEYYVTPVYWPDFDKEELRRALIYYSQRERRFGLVK